MPRLISLFIAITLSAVLTRPAMPLNESTTIVLHAHDGFAACDAPQQNGLDCINGHPNLNLAGMTAPWVFVMLRNYDALAGLQCAFDWPITWTYLGGTWDCQPGTVTAEQPKGPGPVAGTLAMAFNCVQGGSLITIGRMIFVNVTSEGCLSIIEPNRPLGTHVANCDTSEGAAIPPENRGRVCVGPGGYDACWPAATPTTHTTWGDIKAQYR